MDRSQKHRTRKPAGRENSLRRFRLSMARSRWSITLATISLIKLGNAADEASLAALRLSDHLVDPKT